jgi:hypothetical protein
MTWPIAFVLSTGLICITIAFVELLNYASNYERTNRSN